MTNKEKNAWLVRGMAVYILLSAITPILMYQMRDNNRLIVLDGRNSFHVTEYADDEQLVAVYEYTARLAVRAFLMRNPNGLDRPKLFGEMYTGQAKEDADIRIKNELLHFQKYQIHQKAEILKIKVIEADSKRSFIKVSGQLIRSYIEGMEKGTYNVRFEMALGMKTNFDLGKNQLYPFIVDTIKYSQKELKD